MKDDFPNASNNINLCKTAELNKKFDWLRYKVFCILFSDKNKKCNTYNTVGASSQCY